MTPQTTFQSTTLSYKTLHKNETGPRSKYTPGVVVERVSSNDPIVRLQGEEGELNFCYLKTQNMVFLNNKWVINEDSTSWPNKPCGYAGGFRYFLCTTQPNSSNKLEMELMQLDPFSPELIIGRNFINTSKMQLELLQTLPISFVKHA